MNALVDFLQTFGPIPAGDQELVDSVFERRYYKEGEALFESGHVCRELFFIVEGVLRIMVINEKGNEVIHYFLKENQFCTILNSFSNQVMATESIRAACDAEVLAINKSRLEQLYAQLPYLKNRIDHIIQLGLMNKIQTRNAYLGHDSAERYQLFLERQSDIALRVALSDIASYLGITPQSLSRIRKNRMK